MPTFKKIGKKGQEKWTVVFDLPGHTVRKQKRLSGFDTKQEANLEYVSFVANYKPEEIQITTNSDDELLFENAANRYLMNAMREMKESSFITIKIKFTKYILPHFKGSKIPTIGANNILEFYKFVERLKMAFATKEYIQKLLNTFFNYLIGINLIKINPCKKVPMIKNREIKKDIQIWTTEEFKTFINSVDRILYKVLFSFLFLTGCRKGEALALTWKDIVGNIVKIRKTLFHHSLKNDYKITTPKSIYSNRDILMPNDLQVLLCELKEYYREFDLFSEDNFIFGNLKPLNSTLVRDAMRRYCKKSKIKIIRVHDLRHSHASLLISLGSDILTVARRLGHADVKMTLNRYAHLMPNKQLEIVNKLDNII